MAVLLNSGVASPKHLDPDVQESFKKLQGRHQMVTTTLCSCGTTVPEDDEHCARYLQELEVHNFVVDRMLQDPTAQKSRLDFFKSGFSFSIFEKNLNKKPPLILFKDVFLF